MSAKAIVNCDKSHPTVTPITCLTVLCNCKMYQETLTIFVICNFARSGKSHFLRFIMAVYMWPIFCTLRANLRWQGIRYQPFKQRPKTPYQPLNNHLSPVTNYKAFRPTLYLLSFSTLIPSGGLSSWRSHYSPLDKTPTNWVLCITQGPWCWNIKRW